MSFYFRCPHCNIKLEAEDDWNGMETQCPQCNQNITIAPETTQGKPKIQLTPNTVPSSADTRHPISQPLSHPVTSSTSNKFPFVCPSCGTLTELDSSLQNQEYECPVCCEKSIAVPATEKPCPHCGEMIRFQAKICRFCKKSVELDKSTLPSSAQKNFNFPQLTPATSSTVMKEEFDALFFWWGITFALIIPTFGISLIANLVFFCVLLYKYWDLVQSEPGSITPGKAIGFLFIPFFSFYWFFVSFWGLGKVFNTLTGLGKQKLETMSLFFCICIVAQPFLWILIIGLKTDPIVSVYFVFFCIAVSIGHVVCYILSMISFQKAAKVIIQRQ